MDVRHLTIPAKFNFFESKSEPSKKDDKDFEILYQEILEALKEYNDNNAKNQSISLRIFMQETKDHMLRIWNDHQTHSTKRKMQLYALLWHEMFNYLDNIQINFFLKKLKLEKEILYHAYKTYLIFVIPLDEEQLHDFEKSFYTTALKNLIKYTNNIQDNNSTLKDLKKACLELITITKEESHKDKFDVRFHTITLNIVNDLLAPPAIPKLTALEKTEEKKAHCQRLKNLIGDKSIGRRIAGVILMILSAALIAFSILSLFLTLNLSAPLSYGGIGLGLFGSSLGFCLYKQNSLNSFEKKISNLSQCGLKNAYKLI